MPEVTLITGTLAPGTHEFPQVAIPAGIQNISFEAGVATFTTPGSSFTFDLEDSPDGVVWRHHSRAVRPGGTWFEQGGAVSTVARLRFKLESIASTTRRLRGRLILSGASLTTTVKIVYS